MTQEEKVQLILELLHQSRPTHLFEQMRERDSGVMGAVKYLYEQQEAVKSKNISDRLHISSARMVVLLKKLEAKGWVEKYNSPADARVTLVQLSEEGRAFGQRMHDNFYQAVERLIEEFGIDYLIRLLEDMKRLKTIMEQHRKGLEEDSYD